MSTHMPGFQTFLRFLHHFVLVKLASSSIRVKIAIPMVVLAVREHTSANGITTRRILLEYIFYPTKVNVLLPSVLLVG